MQIDIQATHFPVTDALRLHAQRRLRFALTIYGKQVQPDEQIQGIVMRLSDHNRTPGRAEKCCHLRVVSVGMGDVVVEHTEASVYLAIDRAARRAEGIIRRWVRHHRDSVPRLISAPTMR